MPVSFNGNRRTGTLIGAAMTILAFTGALLLAGRTFGEPLSFASFTAMLAALGLLASALAFGYWTWGCASLQYRLTRNTLVIEWAGNQERIPLTAIQNLVPGRELPAPQRLAGVGWLGYRIGRGTVQGQTVLMFANYHAPLELMYVQTAQAVYCITPGDLQRFTVEVKRRLEMGPSTTEVQRNRRWLPWQLSAWHDRVALGLLATAALTNLALFAYQAFVMPAVPDVTVLRFSPLGATELAGPREDLLLLPLAGLAVLLVNTGVGVALHLWERFAAYLTFGAGVLVQCLLFLATVRLLT